MADAGILDGHQAATHWRQVSRLATQYPKVTVEPDAIFVHDRRVWTSAGGTSCIDLAVALIEQDVGRDVALQVARALAVYLKRAGGQSQYRALLDAQTSGFSCTPFGHAVARSCNCSSSKALATFTIE